MNVLAARMQTRLKSLNFRIGGTPPGTAALAPTEIGHQASDLIPDELV